MAFGTSLPSRLPEGSGGTIIYVQPQTANGITPSDANPGTDINNPKKTIGSALATALAAGHKIQLRGNAGEFGSLGVSGDAASITVNAKYGSSSNPITLETYPGDLDMNQPVGSRGEAVINGTRLDLNPGDLKQNDYNSGDGFNWRIRRLKFTGAINLGINGQDFIRTNNGRNLEISECDMDGAGSQGIQVRGMGRVQALSASVDASTTTFTVDATTNLQNATPYYLGVTNTTASSPSWSAVTEVVRVTNVA
ncbi:MAG TPA: hypothetical protein VLA89_08095, partial [Gemmatimonadales bacterium]|nr:hypothetical protein [Gemmatimonadales bacterium]